MSALGEVTYGSRSVREWVRKSVDGEVALADFQRSFVWQPSRSANYMKAILSGRPAGNFITLDAAAEAQFGTKPYSEFDHAAQAPDELVLDGQQRLTSLLHALYRKGSRRIFVEVESLCAASLVLHDVVAETDHNSSPDKDYAVNRVPMDVLVGATDEAGTPLQRWCAEVADSTAGLELFQLHDRITRFFDRNFFNRELHFCALPSTTDTRTAAEVFVETNLSSVKVSAFDIEAAVARGEHNHDMRALVQTTYARPQSLLRHYFTGNQEKWIPSVGNVMLKVACLSLGQTPREKNYRSALEDWLLGELGTGDKARFETTLSDLSSALEWAAELGAPTEKTIPSWPPVYVLAALWHTYSTISDPVKENAARRLLETYYWRSLFSDRYERDVDRRLLDDYRSLKTALGEIRDHGSYARPPPMFDQEEHRVCSDQDLIRAPWIRRPRLGRAVAAVAMAAGGRSKDWVTGKTLGVSQVRQLEQSGKLDRHHIFPKKLLKGEVDEDRMSSALNGVLLDKKTNQRLSRHAPEKYVALVIGQSEDSKAAISPQEMRKRVESHLVPYDAMVAKGQVSKRYERFLDARARVVAAVVEELVSP